MALEASAHDDVLDQILNNYDRSIEDILESADKNQHNTTNSTSQGQSNIPEELGIDTEVKVLKTRKPIPKLDEARLRSANGIPKLQRISKTGLKFRGKGHEFSDVAMLLGTYQLWLDGLYPRSKFADGLAMIEKLGHQKNIQRLRSEWINESKPKREQVNESSEDNIFATADPGAVANVSPQPSVLPFQTVEVNSQSASDVHPGEVPTLTVGTSDPMKTIAVTTGQPDEDELDQLLAEEQELFPFGVQARNSSTSVAALGVNTTQEFDDEEFAAEEEMMRELEFFG